MEQKNLDFSLQVLVQGEQRRFRANYFWSSVGLGACFRLIPAAIPSLAWTGFPEELLRRILGFRNGLVLLCGVTGSGKTTSLATILHRLYQQGGHRIITIEDPIEYVFGNSEGNPLVDSEVESSPFQTPPSLVTQREIGNDVHSFADGLKYGLRQDPDVILVGEIRDGETARMALSAAETGHLVFSTLHARDAKGGISRFLDLFPTHVQGEIRSQLATSLRTIVCQWLLPSINDGEKQQLALEVMMLPPAIGSAIRSGKLESIDNYILTGRAEGMICMNESIKRLVQAGRVAVEVAEQYVTDRNYLKP